MDSMVLLCAQGMFLQGLRKKKDMLYQQLMCRGIPTRTWVSLSSIKDWIINNKYSVGTQSEFFNFGDQKIKSVIDQLSVKELDLVPTLHYHPLIFTFRNGVLFGNERLILGKGSLRPKFYPHSEIPDTIFQSMKYFDYDLDPDLVNTHPSDWRSIRTPSWDQICSAQWLDDGTVGVLCYMLGRLFYNRTWALDKFQVVPFILGLGATGKSTIINFLTTVFDSKILIISSSSEQGFTFQSYDRYVMWACPEITHKTKLSDDIFNMMVAGDGMTMAVKYKETMDRKFDLPGIMAGNGHMAHEDMGGSYSRRVAVFSFNRIVPESQRNPEIEEDMCGPEAGPLILKFLLAYLDWHEEDIENKRMVELEASTTMQERTKRAKTKDFWSRVPKAFRHASYGAVSKRNVFHQFVHHLKYMGLVTHDPRFYMPFSHLKTMFEKFLSDNGTPKDSVTTKKGANSIWAVLTEALQQKSYPVSETKESRMFYVFKNANVNPVMLMYQLNGETMMGHDWSETYGDDETFESYELPRDASSGFEMISMKEQWVSGITWRFFVADFEQLLSANDDLQAQYKSARCRKTTTPVTVQPEARGNNKRPRVHDLSACLTL